MNAMGVAQKRIIRSALLAPLSLAPVQVGGQAVIEGVMMRSPRAMAIAVRRGDGSILVEERPWRSISDRFPLMKRPFLRGTVVLIESMINGIQALNFSAANAMEEEEEQLSNWAVTITMLAAFLFALVFFVVVPHLASGYLLEYLGNGGGVGSVYFHVVDAAIKVFLFLAYVGIIGMMKDIRRLFQYHGAEHKSIHAYENGGALDPVAASAFSRIHPRCGTSFIMAVILVSIALFAVLLPLVPADKLGWMGLPAMILAKVALMVPVAGISYELIRYAGKKGGTVMGTILGYPGILMQRLTTKEPSEDQIEVALVALKKALEVEAVQAS